MERLTGIIMAAGRGVRLGELTQDKPKPLMLVAGVELIRFGLAFLRELGVEKRIVVTGYGAEALSSVVRQFDPECELIHNDEYLKGSATTLEHALVNVDGSFVVMTADHIFRKDIAERAKRQFGESLTIFIDRDRVLGDDDMKVSLDPGDGRVLKLSKTLKEYDCGYVGFSYCPKSLIGLVKETIGEAKDVFGPSANLEHVWQRMADMGQRIETADISGSRWLEVDFPEELARATEEVSNNSTLYNHL